MSVLSVKDHRVTYRTQGGDDPAVRGVSFDIEKGQVLGLAGESGCGKSTIAGAILRLHASKTKIEGDIELDGQKVLDLTPGKLRAVRWTGASIIFQGALHALNPVRRIGDQIAEAIQIHGLAGEREAKVRAGDRRLPAPGFTREPEHLALLDIERDPADGRNVAALRPVRHAEVLDR